MPYNCEECNVIGAKLNNLILDDKTSIILKKSTASTTEENDTFLIVEKNLLINSTH